MDKLNLQRYIYYGIIALISMVAMLFLPMVGSEIGMQLDLPTTAAGWIVYLGSQLMVAIVNVLIFHSFILQAKLNVADDIRYRHALELLRQTKDEKYLPRSLEQFNRREYRGKGVSIFAGSILGAFSIGQAVLTYDWMRLLTYIFTVIMGLVFGVLEMKKYEDYYTGEFVDYAEMQAKKEAENEPTNERLPDLTRGNPTESDGPGGLEHGEDSTDLDVGTCDGGLGDPDSGNILDPGPPSGSDDV